MDLHSLDILEYEKVKTMLAGYAASSLGRAAVQQIAPVTSVARVRLAIDETTEMRQLLALKGRLPVAGMSDVRPVVAGTEESDAAIEPATFGKIRNTLLAALSCKRLFEDVAGLCPRLADLGERLGDFEPLCDQIGEMIDESGEMRDDASPKLAQIRKSLAAAAERLRARAYALAQSQAMRPLLQTEAVSIRRDRYVLAVRAECKHQIDGIIHDRSQTGATVYFEPRELVLLANELDDLRFEERREITRLLWELSFAIRDQREAILATLDALAWVDCTYAKARFSIDYGMSPPEINDTGHLDVRLARHPILVRVLERDDGAPHDQQVVPIDYRLGEDFDLLVITGPNTGGKTVALKTIGILSLMAQSGMHVPADPGARFPCYADILADIGDEQSIEQSLSTFSSHMTNIVRILGKADKRTLVLLDELGSGTDPVEGAAIGSAILDVLHERMAKTAVTTHIGDLRAYAYHHPRTSNAACEFDEKTLQPTYRLLLGQPGNSNAIAIAERLGLPRPIVHRARALAKRRGASERGMIQQLQQSRRAIEDDRETAHRLRKEAEQVMAEAKKELQAARQKARAGRREAEQEIDEHAHRLRSRVLEGLRKLRNAPAPFADKAGEVEALLEAEVERTPLAARRLEFARSLKRDDLVYCIPFGEKCKVRSTNKTRKRLEVVLGHAIVEVSFDDVSWIEPPGPAEGL